MRNGLSALLLVGILLALSDVLALPSASYDVVRISDGGDVQILNGTEFEHLVARGRKIRHRGGEPKENGSIETKPKHPKQKKKTRNRKSRNRKNRNRRKKKNQAAKSCPYGGAQKTKGGKATGAQTKGGKLRTRTWDPDPCRTEEENNKIMIENYQIALKAAHGKKKSMKLEVNHAYLFYATSKPHKKTLKTKLTPKFIAHNAVMVGTVMKVGNELGMEVTMQQLGKVTEEKEDNVVQAVRHENAKVFCGGMMGALCRTGPYRRVECGQMHANFHMVSMTAVEFADPDHFIQTGDDVFMAEKPYNILTWNCRVYRKKLVNVVKLKPGQVVQLTDEQARPTKPKNPVGLPGAAPPPDNSLLADDLFDDDPFDDGHAYDVDELPGPNVLGSHWSDSESSSSDSDSGHEDPFALEAVLGHLQPPPAEPYPAWI